MTTDAANPMNKKAEQRRGFKEGVQQFELLRARWPRAFPARSHEVRPLTNEAKHALIEAFGWSPDYAHGVLAMWKTQPAYCKAILFYTMRINLDGSASGEEVGDAPRAMAKERLEQIAERRAKKAEEKLRAAPEDSAQPQSPEPTPAAIADAKQETATPLEPPKARKLVVAGSAAMQAAIQRRLASGAVTTEAVKTVATPAPGRKREQNAR